MEIIPKAMASALGCIRGQMDPFCLAGGTGLSLFYLQHRVSEEIEEALSVLLKREGLKW